MKKSIIGICLMFVGHLFAQTAQTSIFVDQFGYRPMDKKVGVLSDPQVGFNSAINYSPSGKIGLFSAGSAQLMASYTPVSWNGGAVHDDSGDIGWWVDFSNWTLEGTYYLAELDGTVRSPDFEINPKVYDDVLKEAMRSFYYNRCGMEKAMPFADAKWTDRTSFDNPRQDTECAYVFDSTNNDLVKDLSGGWFDAGDYNKYVTFAHSAVHHLLMAYEENEKRFGDQYDIPESGNAIPDILDEVLYEIEWLMKMNNEDGSTHIKLGSRDYDSNTESPPSANRDPRYYGPTCTSASLAVASNFALASDIFRQFSATASLADELQERAEKCWNYVIPFINGGTLETNCDNGELVAGDADVEVEVQMSWAFMTAVYLFDLTQDQKYNQFIIDQVSSLPPIANSFWGPHEIPLIDAMLEYTTFFNADQTTVDIILNSFRGAVTNNWNGFFGFNEDDLYRAYMPEWSYHWGSNQARASYGIINMLADKYNIINGPVITFQEMAAAQVNHFHGVNPLGLVYLSNMYHVGGDYCANEIYHTWFYDGTIYDHAINSPNGPAPGFVPGGPNQNYSVSGISPPYNQPRMKSYLDFNDGYPNNSWEITEPAIYYQGAYVRLLSWFVSERTTVHADDPSVRRFSVYPNPARVEINFDEGMGGNIQVIDVNGRTVRSSPVNRGNVYIGDLKRGNYWLKIINDEGAHIAPFEKL